jgi:dihydropteroate synthase
VRFPRGPAADAPRDHLGEWVERLEARARPGPDGAAPATLWLEPSALDARGLELLRAVTEDEFEPSAGTLARLTIRPTRLLCSAPSHPALRVLRSTLVAALSPPDSPLVMGILNVTPDSFSDGGSFQDLGAAVRHGQALVEAGADWIDIGGESTRPGAEPVPTSLELERVVPVVRTLARDGRALISIDTTKVEVAQAALAAGARVVNDVSAGRNDPRMFTLVAEQRAGLVLMHAQGSPRDMQVDPRYDDVVREVARHLRARARVAFEAGIAPERIVLDPGFGFGKRLEHNLALLAALPELRSLGFPLCVGLSRKSFLGRLSGQPDAARRGAESVAATALAAAGGATLHRVHEVAPARAALAIAGAVAGPTRVPADSGPSR